MIFQDYAQFYDDLYHDKDYQQECYFIKQVLETYGNSEVTTILDLGCGSGSHALFLAGMGYQVTGVDLAEDMLELAKRKAGEQDKKINFQRGDIRYLELHQRFDAAVAMFTVLGYQTTNQDVENAIASVRKHLSPGGIFICDVWFGPAVLTIKPAERVKIVEKGDGKLIRCAYPNLDILSHTIRVDYAVFEIARDHLVNEVRESHLVRFFFYQELCYFFEKGGFEVIKVCPFLDLDGKPDENCWNIVAICRSA